MAESDVVNAGDTEGGGADSMRDGGGSVMAVAEGGIPSSAASSVGGGGRVRALRLTRRTPADSYGFSLRGGREHGTGFFISHVEPGSEAFLQGLRAGDQVVRVNNMSVDQAVHREVTAMVQANTSVILHIRSTGIIPLKEHRGDPLTWLVVEDDEDFSDHTDSYSQSLPSCSAHESELEGFASPPTHQHSSAHDSHARIYLSCNGKVGLGCSICKGPPEKPGIFVQSVRVGGVARNAGLRPGDQIIACNDVPFARLDFAEAVYVLKSSPRLVVDVIHGAGLDLVAGESSGYNSSASSVAGDQTPPSSSSDPRDSDHSVASRLNAVSRHLTIDRSRGWRDIESEWAVAEAAERRKQLQSSQKALKTRAQRDASHRISSINSRSLSNLSTAVRDEDTEEQRTAFREAGFSPTYPASHHTSPLNHHNTQKHYTLLNKVHKPVLRSAKSTNDVSAEDTSHKIALVTSADPHVNNIVVSGGPKNERDAVLRLDQLSSTSPSRSSTLSSGTSQVTVHSSSGSGSSPSQAAPSPGAALVERQLRELRREQQRLQEEAHRLARERQKFEEEQLGLNDDNSKGELLDKKISALKKERVKTTNSQQDKLIEEIKSKHKKMFTNKEPQDEEKEEDKQELPMPNVLTNVIMPADTKQQTENNPSRNFVLPSQNKQQAEQQNPTRNFILPSQNKQQVEHQNPTRNFVLPSQKKQQAEPQNPSRNFVLPSQSKQQSELSPHRNFVIPSITRQQSHPSILRNIAATTPTQETAEFTSKIINNSIANQKKEPPTPPVKRPLSASQSIATSTPSNGATTSVMQQVMAREAAATAAASGNKTTNDGNNKTGIAAVTAKRLDPVPATTNKVRSPVERQQWSERTGGDGNSSSSSSSTFIIPPLRPTVSSVTVMEFKPEEKINPKVQPPNAYFDMKKSPSTNSGKPLVSISAYPSPNHRPAPVKMGFLPMQGKQQVEVVNGLSATDGSTTPTKASFQRELASTLSRSNLGQHATTVSSATEPPSSSSSGTANGPSPFFTTIQNNAISPKASLSSKYRGIGHGGTQVTIVAKGDSSGKENEAPESLPSGILKPSGPTAPQNKPLQKSISFGDV